jgi:hypothetical protein
MLSGSVHIHTCGWPGPCARRVTWRLNRQTGSSQCRLKKVPPDNVVEDHFTRASGGVCRFPPKTGPRKGVSYLRVAFLSFLPLNGKGIQKGFSVKEHAGSKRVTILAQELLLGR